MTSKSPFEINWPLPVSVNTFLHWIVSAVKNSYRNKFGIPGIKFEYFSKKVLLSNEALSRFYAWYVFRTILKTVEYLLLKKLPAGSEFMGKTFQAAQLFNTRIGIHTRGRWKFSLADIKKIFCRSDLWSKISHVLVVQLETFSP